jgi:hypothetical protein
MTVTATRLYALAAALLVALIVALTAPALAAHLAPTGHQSSFTTSQPDNHVCHLC